MENSCIFEHAIACCSLVWPLAAIDPEMAENACPATCTAMRESWSAELVLPRSNPISNQLHPLVPPQVLHFMQVPLRTSV